MSTNNIPYSIIVHGGAWEIPNDMVKESLKGVQIAAKKGFEILKNGGSACDACEQAVIAMEDNEIFGAGRGSELTELGNVELDACMMSSDLSVGGVCSVRNVKNAITLARKVKEQTAHCLIAGYGAEALAKKIDKANIIDNQQLITQRARKSLEHYQSQYTKAVGDLFNRKESPSSCHDTVGACAIDKNGRIVAATSTGGITSKIQGRVGDSPIVGQGCFACQFGAVSTTGHGESIMIAGLARSALNLSRNTKFASNACQQSLQNMKALTKGCGGLIMIQKDGLPGLAATTKRMPFAFQSNQTKLSGIEQQHIEQAQSVFNQMAKDFYQEKNNQSSRL
mmetsp:Transcript_6014/g.9354  ORF Transcript_6014/g.9354 Transcript_6014/m.9354 type:complete len:338 (+) Transcript_6014:10-1023(+)